jgi:hypothetical protein
MAGTQTRTATMTPSDGKGKWNGKDCGTSVTSQQCATELCPLQCVNNNQWSVGSCEYSLGTCGTGKKRKTRLPGQTKDVNGKDCIRNAEADKVEDWDYDCPTIACPVKVDCKLSDFPAWPTCVTGTRTRSKTIIIRAENGGKECEGPITETESCSVPCVLSDSITWTGCNNGTRTGTKSIVKPAINNGPCDNPTYTERCTVPCAYPPDWRQGTCIGGTRTLSKQSTTARPPGTPPCPILTETEPCVLPRVECVLSAPSWSTCNNGTRTGTRTIITEGANGGQTCPPPSQLNITEPCDVDCVVSEPTWSACIGGTKTGNRTIITQAANNGKPCPSPSELTLTETCTVPCNKDIPSFMQVPNLVDYAPPCDTEKFNAIKAHINDLASKPNTQIGDIITETGMYVNLQCPPDSNNRGVYLSSVTITYASLGDNIPSKNIIRESQNAAMAAMNPNNPSLDYQKIREVALSTATAVNNAGVNTAAYYFKSFDYDFTNYVRTYGPGYGIGWKLTTNVNIGRILESGQNFGEREFSGVLFPNRKAYKYILTANCTLDPVSHPPGIKYY